MPNDTPNTSQLIYDIYANTRVLIEQVTRIERQVDKHSDAIDEIRKDLNHVTDRVKSLEDISKNDRDIISNAEQTTKEVETVKKRWYLIWAAYAAPVMIVMTIFNFWVINPRALDVKWARMFASDIVDSTVDFYAGSNISHNTDTESDVTKIIKNN